MPPWFEYAELASRLGLIVVVIGACAYFGAVTKARREQELRHRCYLHKWFRLFIAGIEANDKRDLHGTVEIAQQWDRLDPATGMVRPFTIRGSVPLRRQ